MKLITLFAALLFCSCATTTFYENGKPVAKFQGDYTDMKFSRKKDGTLTWVCKKVDHSTPTKAGGEAANSRTTGAAVVVSALATAL